MEATPVGPAGLTPLPGTSVPPELAGGAAWAEGRTACHWVIPSSCTEGTRAPFVQGAWTAGLGVRREGTE